MGIIKRLKNTIYDARKGEEYKEVEILTVPVLPPQYRYEIVGSIWFEAEADYGVFGQGYSEHVRELQKRALAFGADAVIAINITHLGNRGSKAYLSICGTAIKFLGEQQAS